MEKSLILLRSTKLLKKKPLTYEVSICKGETKSSSRAAELRAEDAACKRCCAGAGLGKIRAIVF